MCHCQSIIGHGRRLRQAHDDRRDFIWVRRGICHFCRRTFTVLPHSLAPSAHFSFRCRRLACDLVAAGEPIEQATPHCLDPSRSPDPSTVRRWAFRRLLSVACWLMAGVIDAFLSATTILAWDLAALCRILPIGAKSP